VKYFYLLIGIALIVLFTAIRTEIYVVSAPVVVHHFHAEAWLWGFFSWSAHLPWWAVFACFLLEAVLKNLERGLKKERE